jgi:hypothetical protein
LFGSNGARAPALCRTMVHETGWDRVGTGTGGGVDDAQGRRAERRWQSGFTGIR